jgi:5-methyltetrahydrofolate--homocysteine methyltransferase
MNILEELKHKVLISDGAWGTLLQGKGLTPGECPEYWNITHRKEVLQIAASYIEAGSDIIETNSFGGSRLKLSQYGFGDLSGELNEAAASISREAAGSLKQVAGSVGPTGKMLLMGDVTESELYESFKDQAIALEKGGADIIIIETMSALDEASLAVKAARENTKCTVIITMTFSKDMKGEYHTMMGATPSEMVISMKEAGAHIVGSNCGNGIEDMIGVVEAIRTTDSTIPIMIQANAGIPEFIDGVTVYRESPELMASFVPALIKAGANIIGGCCGTTPDHIREMAKALSTRAGADL